ncbi:MAG TPA: choice-of-anchor D domain-containing protein [Candidatus Baltobacteraceae bacterium]|nr:choice-of-anchor D domain-containing protein [Candidatus Baltobacteraceae bacterium]
MNSCPSGGKCRRSVIAFSFVVALAFSLGSFRASAQTPQPWLFVETIANTKPTGNVTFLRDDSSGALTLLAGSQTTFANPCGPATIDPKGRFLYGYCADGLSMYALNTTTGAATEVATSPFQASTGQFGVLVVAESSGQFVYLVKSDLLPATATSTLTLDTFHVDAATPALVPVGSQTLPIAGAWVDGGAVGDPNGHGIAILINQFPSPPTQFPNALLYLITFDPLSGAVTLDPTGGTVVGSRGLGIRISARGNFLALGYGSGRASLSMYQVNPVNFALTPLGTEDLGSEQSPSGTDQMFPNSIFFDPTGQVTYVQVPLSGTSNCVNCFELLDTSTFLVLPSSPLPVSDAGFLTSVQNPQAPFTYAATSANGVFAISAYEVDPGTGLPSQPGAISQPFFQQSMQVLPVVASLGPAGGQGTVGPVLSPSALDLSFPDTVTGQKSASQSITLTSSGDQAVSFQSVSVTGANAADFEESDNCVSTVVLQPKHSCTIFIVYAPTSVGPSLATLNVLDSAVGNPQQYGLSGAGVAPPPQAPVVTLDPTGTFNLAGTTTQGTTAVPQNLTVSNTGTGPLHVTTIGVSGLNAGDFSISGSNCLATAVAAGASCAIPVTFAPLASGIRTTTLSITDDAANSPQMVTLNATAAPAATIVAAAGATLNASVTAGQTATFNLQATPGAGFSGTLAFACSGMPLGTTCIAPSVTVTSGATVSFTVSVTTSGNAPAVSSAPRSFPGLPRMPLVASVLPLVLLVLVLSLKKRERGKISAITFDWKSVAALVCLAFLANGCGGGGSATSEQLPPPIITPTGTYILMATPSATPTGSSKSFPLPAIPLTLVVK